MIQLILFWRGERVKMGEKIFLWVSIMSHKNLHVFYIMSNDVQQIDVYT